MEIELSVNRDRVMTEVAVTTAYAGGKMLAEDDKALHRISTVDEDAEHLHRFWDICRTRLCQELTGLISSEQVSENNDYELRLHVSKAFDSSLLWSMQLSLFSYFVHGIVAQWYVYTNKNDAGDYSDKATILLEDIHRKAVYKKKPTRPNY